MANYWRSEIIRCICDLYKECNVFPTWIEYDKRSCLAKWIENTLMCNGFLFNVHMTWYKTESLSAPMANLWYFCGQPWWASKPLQGPGGQLIWFLIIIYLTVLFKNSFKIQNLLGLLFYTGTLFFFISCYQMRYVIFVKRLSI